MIDCSGNDNDEDGTKGDDHEKKKQTAAKTQQQ